jgi:hypothetical protein
LNRTNRKNWVHLFLVGLVLSLSLSTFPTTDRVGAMEEMGTGIIDIAGAGQATGPSLMKCTPWKGGTFYPWGLGAEGMETPRRGLSLLRDGTAFYCKTADKGCLIVGLTETRK